MRVEIELEEREIELLRNLLSYAKLFRDDREIAQSLERKIFQKKTGYSDVEEEQVKGEEDK